MCSVVEHTVHASTPGLDLVTCKIDDAGAENPLSLFAVSALLSWRSNNAATLAMCSHAIVVGPHLLGLPLPVDITERFAGSDVLLIRAGFKAAIVLQDWVQVLIKAIRYISICQCPRVENACDELTDLLVGLRHLDSSPCQPPIS